MKETAPGTGAAVGGISVPKIASGRRAYQLDKQPQDRWNIVLAKTTLVEDKTVPEQVETNELALAAGVPKTEPDIAEDSTKEVFENPSAEEDVVDAIEEPKVVQKQDDVKDTEDPIEAPVQEPAVMEPDNLPEEANADEKKVEAVMEKEEPEKKD